MNNFLWALKFLTIIPIDREDTIKPKNFGTSVKCVSCFISPILVNKCAALLLMPVVGRWAQVCAAGLSKYARSESGTGSFILGGTAPKHVIYASLLPVFLVWFFYNLSGFVIFSIIIIFTLIWFWYINRKNGWMTEDTLGNINEITELVFLLGILLVDNSG